jgi:hypothetical protein
MNLLAYNLVSAMKGLCLDSEERTARLKKFRLLIIHLAGRLSRNGCVLRLRFCATAQTIKRIAKVWEVFTLPTQATRLKSLRSRLVLQRQPDPLTSGAVSLQIAPIGQNSRNLPISFSRTSLAALSIRSKRDLATRKSAEAHGRFLARFWTLICS